MRHGASRRAKGHHSLVTPIDWKQHPIDIPHRKWDLSHHSLVTPIDWKPMKQVADQELAGVFDTAR